MSQTTVSYYDQHLSSVYTNYYLVDVLPYFDMYIYCKIDGKCLSSLYIKIQLSPFCKLGVIVCFFL